ncbi:hypothetical protein J001_04442 [Cryptococcus neoformans]|nr:hypothetical protein J001_04442 [Cryptococcus neoformans var. grubii]
MHGTKKVNGSEANLLHPPPPG